MVLHYRSTVGAPEAFTHPSGSPMSKIDGIAQTILKRIRTNTYIDKIPGERALAAEFSVDFKTANRAISALVKQGTLIRKRGLGTFIAPINQRRDLTIGLCFFKHSDPGRDPVFNRFFAGMNREIKNHGLRLDVTSLSDIVGTTAKPLHEQIALFRKQVLAPNPDGLIYLGNINTQLIELLRADRPTIVVAQTPDAMQFDTVRRNVADGIAAAVGRFHALGHRRIALATYQHDAESYDLTEKETGYQAAVASLDLESQILKLTYPPEGKLAQLVLDAKPRPTAIVCTESTLGLAIIAHGPALGLRIPQDIAVISYDDGDNGSYANPPMSNIIAFGEELAHRAVQRLIEKLDGKAAGRICEVLPCPYFEHQSSGTQRPS